MLHQNHDQPRSPAILHEHFQVVEEEIKGKGVEKGKPNPNLLSYGKHFKNISEWLHILRQTGNTIYIERVDTTTS